jgi:hypothetical protein
MDLFCTSHDVQVVIDCEYKQLIIGEQSSNSHHSHVFCSVSWVELHLARSKSARVLLIWFEGF